MPYKDLQQQKEYQSKYHIEHREDTRNRVRKYRRRISNSSFENPYLVEPEFKDTELVYD